MDTKTPFSKRGAATLANGEAESLPPHVREFMAQMEHKQPHRVLGSVVDSRLTGGVVTATLGTMAMMAVLTLGPYAWGLYAAKPAPAEANPPAAATAATAPAEGNQPAGTPAASTTAGKPGSTPANGAVGSATADSSPATKSPDGVTNDDKQKAVGKLGVDEVKQSDPDKNPLDNKIDDLLDNLK